MEGDALTEAFYGEMEKLMRERVKPKRFGHVESVSKTAVKLARRYGVDPKKARLAGLLHDWDKDYNDDEIRQRVFDLGMQVDPAVLDGMPQLLHGPTAAAALGLEYPEIGEDILQAIRRHTAGAVGMTELDMVVYIADAIEPTRPYGNMDGVRKAVGKVGLEELFLLTYQQIFLHLVDRRMTVHPDTAKIWNYYIERSRNSTR